MKKKSAIRDELSRLYGEHNKLTATMVVKEATPEKSPLHKHFEWDNKKAGHKYRLMQANTLIREIHTIKVKGKSQTLIHAPVGEVVKGESREGDYLAEDDLAQNVDAYMRALDAAQRDLDSALRRINEVKALRRTADPEGKYDLAIKAIEAAKLALAS